MRPRRARAAAAAGVRRRGPQLRRAARRRSPRARPSCSRPATAPSRSRRSRRRDPRQAQDHPADVGGAHLRQRRADREDRPHGGPVRQAALRPTETRDGMELPSFRGDIVNDFAFEAGGPPARPAAAAAGLPPVGRDAEPRCAPSPRAASPTSTQVHAWNQEFVGASRRGPALRGIAREIERALRFMAACGIDLERRAPAPRGRLLHRHEGAPPRLRGGAHPARQPHRRLVRLLGPPAVDRRAHPSARRRARGVLLAGWRTRSA